MMAIRVIDLETTGIDATDHVVEVGSVDLLQDGSITRHQDFLVHPPCPIPAEARAVHHISDEDVAQAKSWDAVSSIFFDRGNCSDLVAFAAHNAAFDQQWLVGCNTHILSGRRLFARPRRHAAVAASFNQCCALAFVLESILLILIVKIVLQHNLPRTDIDFSFQFPEYRFSVRASHR
jgi:Exonuclease